ncbi:Uncharacterized protein FWK35_00023842, partial [Aphis craccivora]
DILELLICHFTNNLTKNYLFRFPKEQGLKQLWMNKCQIKLCLPSYRVCSNHFSPEHILTNGLLKKNAVPSVRLLAFAATSQLDEHSVPDSSTQNTQNASDSLASSSLKRTPARKKLFDNESSPLKHSSILSSPPSLAEKRRFINAHNIGNLDVDHFCTPKRAERHLTMVKQKFSEKQIKSNKLKRQVNILQNKINSYEDLIESLKYKQFLSENAANQLQISGSDVLRDIIKRKMAGEKTQYSNELRKFAITLQFYSPKAYTFVRKSFADVLPHPKSITRWYKVINGEPGFSNESFLAIASKAKDEVVLCNIVIDEISIRNQIEYNGKKMYGFVDLGTGINIDTDELPHATYALVFLAVGLNGSERGNLLQKSLELMHETGAKVHSITFDGAHTNTAMCKHLGANFSTSESRFFIEHPVSKEPVFIFYDACHILKLIRNTFGDKKLLYNDKNEEINWDYIKKLYDKENNEGLKLATKLSSRHIFYFNEKMNVKLAAQVMSNSVSNGLKCCDHLGDSDFKGSQGTAEFYHIETFFSAVRMRGGHNNNPTCKQFFTAYKKLLVHNQATGSQYGNCLAMLDPTELSVVNVGPDSITSQINETDEAIVVEHDHSYFQTLNRLYPLWLKILVSIWEDLL